jgi:hypothetical protein
MRQLISLCFVLIGIVSSSGAAVAPQNATTGLLSELFTVCENVLTCLDKRFT